MQCHCLIGLVIGLHCISWMLRFLFSMPMPFVDFYEEDFLVVYFFITVIFVKSHYALFLFSPLHAVLLLKLTRYFFIV